MSEQAVEEQAVEKERWVAEVPTSTEHAVDQLLQAISGLPCKFNREQSLSVADLKHRNEPQGTRFRQVFVKDNGSSLTVTLVESFKSAHGGNEQRNNVAGFTVPMTETDAFGKLHRRFFGWSEENNTQNAKYFLDELDKTLR